MASCRARLLARFRSSGQLEPRTVKPRMVAYPFCPSWAAVGEQVTAGYAAFFFSLYRTRLSVIAHQKLIATRPGDRQANGTTRTKWFFLCRVGELDSRVVAAESVAHLSRQIPGANHCLADATAGECLKLVSQERSTGDRRKTLRHTIDNRPQPRSQPTRKNEAGRDRLRGSAELVQKSAKAKG
jgi:hypothetical protein